MKCKHCNQGVCIKHGIRNGKQRYRCKLCKRTSLLIYHYTGAEPESSDRIICGIKNGLGLRNLSRVLRIATSTIIRRIKNIGSRIVKPRIFCDNQNFEMDEMYTFIGRKDDEHWIFYAIEQKSKQVIDFVVGRRTSENAKKVIGQILNYSPSRIYTDRLNLYPKLIPRTIHSQRLYGTNHIERNNLTIRTNLKRLQRKTIAYSKSKDMLENCLKIFFWG